MFTLLVTIISHRCAVAVFALPDTTVSLGFFLVVHTIDHIPFSIVLSLSGRWRHPDSTTNVLRNSTYPSLSTYHQASACALSLRLIPRFAQHFVSSIITLPLSHRLSASPSAFPRHYLSTPEFQLIFIDVLSPLMTDLRLNISMRDCGTSSRCNARYM